MAKLNRSAVWVLAVFFSLLKATFGQDAPAADLPTLKLGSNLVFVPAQVQTKKGEMIYGLKPQQFVLEDNGVPQKFRVDEDTDARGISLVVVVQCSREAFMQFDRMKGLAAMVDDLTGGAPRQVAVVSYGSEPELVGKFTDDPDRLARNLAELEPCEDGGAVTLDAVDFANRLFDKDPKTTALTQSRRAILLIGETRDHGSKVKAETVVAELGRSNTVVDSVSFNPGKTAVVDSLIHGQMGPGPMGLLFMAVQAVRKNVPHSLAGLTGGEYTNFTTQKGFDSGIHKLANHIHNYYLLSFTPSTGDGKPVVAGLHRLVVKVPDYPDAQIRSRLTYYAGDAAPPDVPEK
jgi:VWFA-related protein